jgi:hypothetical protein
MSPDRLLSLLYFGDYLLRVLLILRIKVSALTDVSRGL